MLHGTSTCCMVTNTFAFQRIHVTDVSCILVRCICLPSFIRTFNVALQCIWYKVHSCAFSCILCIGCIPIACCIHVMRMNASECARMHLTVGPDHHLDTVIVSAGKTVDQIKMMPFLEKKKHAEAATRTAPSRRNRSTSWRPSGAARPSTPPSTRRWAGCSSTSCRHENA